MSRPRTLPRAELGLPPRRRRRARFEELRAELDRLVSSFDAKFLSTDPLQFLHRYRRADDLEVVGLLASGLAYGQVGQVLASVAAALAKMGPHPSDYVRRLQSRDALDDFRGFKHRFNDARDVVCLLDCVRRAWAEHGTLGDLFAAGFRPEHEDIGPALSDFSSRLVGLMDRQLYERGELPASVRFFFPRPPQSACKRLNLFLRWMVRPADGLDFGLWKRVPPRALVVPLDTHVARISSFIGLTGRRTMGWEMAREITANLRRLDPDDPVKYDFAICRLGILDRCPRRRDPACCRACPLLSVCLL